jgi:excisionase family DNA binding protein
MTVAFPPMPKVIPMVEAAERLGVHESTIRRWIGQGKLKPYRIHGDRRRFVSVDEVEALREPQELPPREDRR